MRRGLVSAAVVSLLVLGVGPAGARMPTVQPIMDVRNAGRCTGGDSTYSLAVSRYDRNRLRVRFRIAHSTPGQTWQIFGSDDGERIFAVKRDVSSDGTASVRRRIPDRHGKDKVKVAASNSTSGEACNATVKSF
ncbi:MAG: hypothetical protein M3P43_16010 [Actinomycetota bacterium]|nr:hypothetical protein [Actinomycetota bacterium]